MATILARQLAAINQKATNSLDTKAQRLAHGQSLLFEKEVAVSQDFDTLYDFCIEGYRDLCSLDRRFLAFSESIFSDESKAQDRLQMTAIQNSQLDEILRSFLSLASAKLLIKPAQKALEWVIRRFKVHDHDADWYILSFLPYHNTALFTKAMAILPSTISPAFKFLHPYLKSQQRIPYSVIVYAGTNNLAFSRIFAQFITSAHETQRLYPLLLSFWTGVTAEALTRQVDEVRGTSGTARNAVEEDIMLRLLPTLNEGLNSDADPEFQLACQLVALILFDKVRLKPEAANSFADAIVTSMSANTTSSGYLCLISLFKNNPEAKLSSKRARRLLERHEVVSSLRKLQSIHNIEPLVCWLIKFGLKDGLKRGEDVTLKTATALLTDCLSTGPSRLEALSFIFQQLALTNETGLGQMVLEGLKRSSENEFFRMDLINADEDGAIAKLENRYEIVLLNPSTSQKAIEAGGLNIDREEPMHQDFHFTLQETDLPTSFFPTDNSTASLSSTVQQFERAIHDNRLAEFESLPVVVALESETRAMFWSTLVISLKDDNHKACALQALIKCLSTPISKVLCRKGLPTLLFVLSHENIVVRDKGITLVHEISKSIERESGESSDSAAILRIIAESSLEDIRSDPSQIERLCVSMIKGKSHGSQKVHLSTRQSLVQALARYANQTNDLRVMLFCVKVLNSVTRFDEHSRPQLLSKLRHDSLELSGSRIVERCHAQNVEIEEVTKQIARIYNVKDVTELQLMLQDFFSKHQSIHEGLQSSAIKHISDSWSKIGSESQELVLKSLIDASTKLNHMGRILPMLQELPLSSAELDFLLSLVPEFQEQEEDQPNKRQKVQRGNAQFTTLSPDLNADLQLSLMLLEVVDNAKDVPSRHILPQLARFLRDLTNLKASDDINLEYHELLSLNCLQKVLGMIQAGDKTSEYDIPVDCVLAAFQSSSSPQIQATAVLVINQIARIMPDTIVHHVMPIFTKMGASLMRRNDAYSTHIVYTTIDAIVPPLVAAWRQAATGPERGVSELVLNFVAAFYHIPSEGRQALFIALATRLGPADFLHIIVSLLNDKYPGDSQILSFSIALSNHFNSIVQLMTLEKLCTSIHRQVSEQSADNPAKETRASLQNIMHFVQRLLETGKFGAQLIKADKSGAMDADEEHTILATKVLQLTLEIIHQTKAQRKLSQAAGLMLNSLLKAMPTSLALEVLQSLLQHEDVLVKEYALKSFEKKIRQIGSSDLALQRSCRSVLPILTAIIEEASAPSQKRSAVSILDFIVERLGKKIPEEALAVVSSVLTYVSNNQSDAELIRLSIYCFATATTTLADGALSIVPTALQFSIKLAQGTVETSQDQAVVDAVFHFFMGLLDHLQWILGRDDLSSIVDIALAVISQGSAAIQEETLELMVRRISPDIMVDVFSQTRQAETLKNCKAILTYLRLLRQSITQQSKSLVTKNSPTYLEIFKSIFELRRVRRGVAFTQLKDDDFATIDEQAAEVLIQMVYKLNDASFRPIFTSLMEWAASSKLQEDDQTARATSVFAFLSIFFSTLRSIVTNYSGLVMPLALETIKRCTVTDSQQSTLLQKVYETMRSAFGHDKDDFWQNPSRFEAISKSLVGQIARSRKAGATLTNALVDAISQLGRAADSPENMKSLNQMILQHMRSEHAEVRLAAVRCEVRLTEKLGEEWLSLLPEMLPFIGEMMEDDDEEVETNVLRWIKDIEGILGESLDPMLQ